MLANLLAMADAYIATVNVSLAPVAFIAYEACNFPEPEADHC